MSWHEGELAVDKVDPFGFGDEVLGRARVKMTIRNRLA